MPNNFATTNWVSMKILWFFKNSYEVAAQFNSEWESEFGKSFPIGSSAQIKFPQQWLVTTGLAYQEQGINRLVTTVNLDQIRGIHFAWDSYERLVKMERSEKELDESYLYPAGQQLAQQIDSDAANWARLNCPNVQRNPRNRFDHRKLCLRRRADAVFLRLPARRRQVPTIVHFSIIDGGLCTQANVTQFNPQKDISDMYRKGVIGNAGGWKWVRSNLPPTADGWYGGHTHHIRGRGGSNPVLRL